VIGMPPDLPSPTSLDVASHFGCDQWAYFLPEQTTAVSLLDRLIHHSTIVVAAGESYRMRDARKKRGGRRTPDHGTRGGDNFPAKTGDFKLAVDRKSAFWAATNATTLTRDSFTRKP